MVWTYYEAQHVRNRKYCIIWATPAGATFYFSHTIKLGFFLRLIKRETKCIDPFSRYNVFRAVIDCTNVDNTEAMFAMFAMFYHSVHAQSLTARTWCPRCRWLRRYRGVFFYFNKWYVNFFIWKTFLFELRKNCVLVVVVEYADNNINYDGQPLILKKQWNKIECLSVQFAYSIETQ